MWQSSNRDHSLLYCTLQPASTGGVSFTEKSHFSFFFFFFFDVLAEPGVPVVRSWSWRTADYRSSADYRSRSRYSIAI